MTVEKSIIIFNFGNFIGDFMEAINGAEIRMIRKIQNPTISRQKQVISWGLSITYNDEIAQKMRYLFGEAGMFLRVVSHDFFTNLIISPVIEIGVKEEEDKEAEFNHKSLQEGDFQQV